MLAAPYLSCSRDLVSLDPPFVALPVHSVVCNAVFKTLNCLTSFMGTVHNYMNIVCKVELKQRIKLTNPDG